MPIPHIHAYIECFAQNKMQSSRLERRVRTVIAFDVMASAGTAAPSSPSVELVRILAAWLRARIDLAMLMLLDVGAWSKEGSWLHPICHCVYNSSSHKQTSCTNQHKSNPSSKHRSTKLFCSAQGQPIFQAQKHKIVLVDRMSTPRVRVQRK